MANDSLARGAASAQFAVSDGISQARWDAIWADESWSSGLVKIIAKNGDAQYGRPNHSPMNGWNDYTLLSEYQIEKLKKSSQK